MVIPVSTDLMLFDHTWLTAPVNCNLLPPNIGEERQLGVSTSLTILPLMNEAMIEAVKSKKGLRVLVSDLETESEQHLTFRLWSSSRSYVFNDNWNESFVRRRSLKLGDEIGLCRDPYNCKFNFCVFRRA